MFEQGSVGSASVGSHYNSDKADSNYRIRTKKLIELEIGEQYVFLGDNNYLYSARFFDKNGNKVSHDKPYDLSWKGTTPFTILNDTPMCAFFIKIFGMDTFVFRIPAMIFSLITIIFSLLPDTLQK